jgi:hypothetical protein
MGIGATSMFHGTFDLGLPFFLQPVNLSQGKSKQMLVSSDGMKVI